MKKLTVVIALISMLLLVNVSYGWNDHKQKQDQNQKQQQAQAQAQAQGQLQAQGQRQDVDVDVDVSNRNTNINYNRNINLNANVNVNKNSNENLNENSNTNSNTATNHGNSNEININDNSVYTEVLNSTDLLNPAGYVPLSEKLFDNELHISKSIFRLQRETYNYKELTRFANPGRFLGFLWPEWDNKYHIEIATFTKYKAKRTIRILPAGIVTFMGLTKIGEGQAFAKDLNKSEHQVMAATAFRAAQAGATVVVFKSFSTSLTKVDSFVIGGGGVQTGSPQSIFNGAAGIGSSSSETVTRAGVLVELYR